MRGEPIEECRLPLQDSLPRFGEDEPLTAIDLGEFLHPAGPFGPFYREEIALDRGRVAIAFKGPSRDEFATWLADLTKRNELSRRPNPGLLLEFPLRRGEGVLAFGI